MNDAPALTSERWRALPVWLRPRDREPPAETGSLRLIETTLLLLICVILAAATLNDLVRQLGINERLAADLKTWRVYTHRHYHNLNIQQELYGKSVDKEVVCGNRSPGPPGARVQICLVIYGPVHGGTRKVLGGWNLPPKIEDVKENRFNCFGYVKGLCPK